MRRIPPIRALTAVLSLWSVSAVAQVPGRSLLRQLYGDLAFDVRTGGPGTLMLGVADARVSVVITVLAADVRRWADSATLVLTAPAPRRGQSAKWEAVVAGPGVAAGSMALSRRVAPGDTAIVLLVTDAAFQGVRTELTMSDARALASAMRRAAVAALAPAAAVPPMKKPPR